MDGNVNVVHILGPKPVFVKVVSSYFQWKKVGLLARVFLYLREVTRTSKVWVSNLPSCVTKQKKFRGTGLGFTGIKIPSWR